MWGVNIIRGKTIVGQQLLVVNKIVGKKDWGVKHLESINQSLAGKMSPVFKVSFSKKVCMTRLSLTQSKTKSINNKKLKRPGPDHAQPCKVPDFLFSNTHVFVNNISLFLCLFLYSNQGSC